ncbi:MAG: valine--tRNA ligase [Candidatus Wallbacteria bacterium]|nr:valine--tRNA ligase [Candidatus Wallbacteria bacterium]
MPIELEKAYNPKAVEDTIYAAWSREDLFRVDNSGSAKKPYCIVIPPPNVTGRLHMGHALNNTLQDILVRWRRLAGDLALWLPGTDHAGIATQNVVEKELAKEGKSREALGREAFEKRVWAWKDEYGNAIIEQLKRLGASCDWSRTRFTLDPGLNRAVREVFVGLYRKGLIYRGDYIVNWCPRCQTALSDIEVEYQETQGKLWHIRYPSADGGPGVVVATTRPETMLGDVAVAVHPEDERYSALVGSTVVLPVVERQIPVIADSFVDRAFGTGCVKITPAHDPNDFEAGRRNGLTPLNVMNPDATINAAGGQFAGQTREACRKNLVAMLEERQLLVKVEEHQNSVGHCYRCDTVVEPYLSRQWFVKMKDLAEPAMRVVREKKVEFVPPRWEKLYFDWMENIKDWCISRQLWWGHRIPAAVCSGCGQLTVEQELPEKCAACGGALVPDPDVLDTWFSSALWPFSTLGWPQGAKDLDVFYPTSTLVTDRGIIFFWVARMIMAGLEFMGREPFRHVYIHGTILDHLGRKMSKSLGNGIDPLEVIDEYGADAMRFSLMMLSAGGQDIKLSKDKFEMGRNFANKLWNAARFLLMNVPDAGARSEPSTEEFADRWIVSRFQAVAASTTRALEEFDFHAAVTGLYEFTWNEFCDWYVEFIKPRIREEAEPETRAQALATAQYVLTGILRLLHPFMPFVTEEIWGHLPSKKGRLMTDSWPVASATLRCEETEREMELLQKLVRSIRTIRSEMNVKPSQQVTVRIKTEAPQAARVLERHGELLKGLARVADLAFAPDMTQPPQAASDVVAEAAVYVPLAGLIDIARERERLARDLGKQQKDLEGMTRKLANEKFVANAPAEIVLAEQAKRERLSAICGRLERLIASLDA